MRDILIVEDGQRERERLAQLFTAANYRVAACEGVAEAERELQSSPFRLAFLDIGLSDRSGSYLFNSIRRTGRVERIIIFTGNPSVHLKQRFLDEGATDYLVKGSPAAGDEQLLRRVQDLLGAPEARPRSGIELATFLSTYLTPQSARLFLDQNDNLPECGRCGASEYLVVFDHCPQMPPDLHGQVICKMCGQPMDPEVG